MSKNWQKSFSKKNLDRFLFNNTMKNSLSNKNVLITAGATYEPIDPVRFIGNRSSGKQGIEIAKVMASAD